MEGKQRLGPETGLWQASRVGLCCSSALGRLTQVRKERDVARSCSLNTVCQLDRRSGDDGSFVWIQQRTGASTSSLLRQLDRDHGLTNVGGVGEVRPQG
jgi:hypothetical protein